MFYYGNLSQRAFINTVVLRFVVFPAVTVLCLLAASVSAQQSNSPVIVQPGAPGQSTQRLSSDTRIDLPKHTAKDVEFMQGMIMHHAQAVEMVALIKDRTQNRSIRLIGERIGISQADEIEFMKRWLTGRGESDEMPGPGPAGHHSHGSHSSHGQSSDHSMPGMLSAAQMEALRKAKGAEFDHLFLTGMIMHHEGALVMVKELFDSPGAGQDAELFKFATDVDNDQRAEIKTMQTLLDEKP